MKKKYRNCQGILSVRKSGDHVVVQGFTLPLKPNADVIQSAKQGHNGPYNAEMSNIKRNKRYSDVTVI